MAYCSVIMIADVLSSSAHSISFFYNDFSSDTPAMQLNVNNGAPTITGTGIRLLNGTNFQATSAFYPNLVTLGANKAFSTEFAFQTVGGWGADGFTFTVHREATGANATGADGAYLGYGGIGNLSAAVEFDTYDDAGLARDHVAIDVAGQMDHALLGNGQSGYDFFTGNPIYYVWVDYDGTTMEVRLSTTDNRPVSADVSHTFDLSTTLGNPPDNGAYFGFTGSTGGLAMTVNILKWRFISSYNPIPNLSYSPPVQSLAHTIEVYDPLAQNLKAIPDNHVVVSGLYQNEGAAPDASSVKLTLPVNSNLAFEVNSLTYTDGASGNAVTGLSCCSGSEIQYSDTGISGPWTYTPTGAYDANVRAVQIIPSGTMNAGSSGSPVGFKVDYRAKIQ